MKFHVNWDNQAYRKKKKRFSTEACYQIWDLHWIRDIETSLGVVSDPDSEFCLALHAKRDKTFNFQFTNYLEKCEFLQTTSNIDILYTVGKYFSSRVWIWDLYRKIMLHLAQIDWQKLSFLHRKTCWRFKHFRHKWKVPLYRGGQGELVRILKWRWEWPKKAFHRCSFATSHALCIIANSGDWIAEEQRSLTSATSEADWPARAVIGAAVSSYLGSSCGSRWGEKNKRERKKEWEGEKGRLGRL